MKLRMMLCCLICLLLTGLQATAQVTVNPKIERKSLPHINITKVEHKDTYTIIDMDYTNPAENGLACARLDYFIRAIGSTEKKFLARAENIPYCPTWKSLKQGEKIFFKLYFPYIGPGIYKIDVIEGTDSTTFNFFGVNINNKARPNTKPAETADNKVEQTKTTGSTNINETTGNEKSSITFNNKPLSLKDSVSLNILFEHASDKFQEQSKPELEKLAAFMKKYPSLIIQLEGHTERDEPYYLPEQRASNKKLSEERVANVRYYLVQKGIPAARIQTKAYGGTKPVSSDPLLNRRVVMKIVKF